MADVVCIGEILIDLVPTITGVSLADAETFVKAAGGAPANVAVGLARLGVSSAFMGAVGDDGFGRFLVGTLSANGVDVSGVRRTDAAPTALAAVSLAGDGDRDFIFYGHPAAHTTFAPADIDVALFQRAKILHFGSIGLIDEPARSATMCALDLAEEHGLLVSFDPNLRLLLWPDADAARSAMRLGVAHANIVKISAEEVEFLTSACDLWEAARSLWHPNLRFMAVTRGAKGCLWLTADSEGEHPGFAAAAIDTTGAGDAFTAALLSGLLPAMAYRAAGIPDRLIEDIVDFANAAGALSTIRRGAIPALPKRDEIQLFLAQIRNRFAIRQ